jgi:hypothetical protein
VSEHYKSTSCEVLHQFGASLLSFGNTNAKAAQVTSLTVEPR